MTHIILFDGDCQLCHSSVQFIIKRDPKIKFKFASLESNIGKDLLKRFHMPVNVTSLILINKDKCYNKSSAALHICKSLKGIWKICYLFLIIPKPIRDYIYDIVAKNRYKWFSKRKSCPIPASKDRQRLL